MQTIAEFEAAAREKLDPVYYDFFAGAARDEITMRANEESFQRRWLLPRVLRGSDKRELGVTLFGRPVSMPILLSPTAFHRIAHPEGERATARAAALAGTIMIVSMAATTAVGDVVTAAREAVQGGDPTLWFQLYLQPDLAFSEAIVRRAEDAGVHALVVTVDSPVFGRRERDDRNNFHELPAGMFVENLRDDHAGTPRDIVMSAELSWQHIDWLRGLTSLPIVLKGVLHPEDARIAVSRGVDGLLVSNHGGRQLDTVPATIDALPELVEAVGGQLPLILDGGVRRGTDVVKALALGATAVGIGRPVMWGLAAAGQDGVSQVLELLREEFDHALALCGGSTPRDLTADLIRTY
ncbi:MAG: FMN-dependent alpha-hydroxy acid dehydrogenase [Amycolatopsis sp.]|jgi:4-hydroxymandelate oxidase|uniref:alpha-hydroxy acid oxidase n=1 Tax=Amycolatopsis sp. TaxID=37632 RepID=UPI0026195C9A|nr:alpha-hydroxy acid oxidase [Amycolatopsis sp.]MCU1684090.1 FMN-dependent alpha-hydroxy acid dehydrogenase [Amycolatopsis sp.]